MSEKADISPAAPQKNSKYAFKTYEYADAEEGKVNRTPRCPSLKAIFRTVTQFEESCVNESYGRRSSVAPSSTPSSPGRSGNRRVETPRGHTARRRVFFPDEDFDGDLRKTAKYSLGEKLKQERSSKHDQQRFSGGKKGPKEEAYHSNQLVKAQESDISSLDSGQWDDSVAEQPSIFEVTLPRKYKDDLGQLKEKYDRIEHSRKPTPFSSRRKRAEQNETDKHVPREYNRTPTLRPVTPLYLLKDVPSRSYTEMPFSELVRKSGHPYPHVRSGHESARSTTSGQRKQSEEYDDGHPLVIEHQSGNSRPIAVSEHSPQRLADKYNAAEFFSPQVPDDTRPSSGFSLENLRRTRPASSELETYSVEEYRRSSDVVSNYSQKSSENVEDSNLRRSSSVKSFWDKTVRRTGVSINEILEAAREEANDHYNQTVEEVRVIDQLDPETYAPMKGGEGQGPASPDAASSHGPSFFPDNDSTMYPDFPSEELATKKAVLLGSEGISELLGSKTKTSWGTPWSKVHLPDQGVMRILDSPEQKRTADNTPICSPFIHPRTYVNYHKGIRAANKRAQALQRWAMIRRVVLGDNGESSEAADKSEKATRQGGPDEYGILGEYEKKFVPLTSPRTRQARLEKLLHQSKDYKPRSESGDKKLKIPTGEQQSEHPSKVLNDYYLQLLSMTEEEYDRHWIFHSTKNSTKSSCEAVTGYRDDCHITQYEKPYLNPTHTTLGKPAVSLVDVRRRVGLSPYRKRSTKS